MGVKGFSDGEQSPGGEATGHLTALALPPGVVNKNQKLSKRNFMRKTQGQRQIQRGCGGSWLLAIRTVKGLKHNYRRLLGKEID